MTFAVKHEALKAYANGEASFTADGQDYTMDADGNILSGGDEIGYVSRFVVQAKENGQKENQEKQVVIKVDGEVYGRYSLDEDQVIEVQEGDFYNRIRIEDGKAEAGEVSC